MKQWSVPQYARELARKASIHRLKRPTPVDVEESPLSASWPRLPQSRSNHLRASSPAPSFCTAHSGDGSGAWWEAVLAGSANTDAPQPPVPSSPGAARSPAASRMISRMLSVLPEGADELAQTQSLLQGGPSGPHGTGGTHVGATAAGAAVGVMPRASSSEMTIVTKREPAGPTPLRYAGSPHVNRHSGAAACAPAPWAAAGSGAGNRAAASSSSGAPSSRSSAASVAIVPFAAACASKARSGHIAPTDPRLGPQRIGAGGSTEPHGGLRGGFPPAGFAELCPQAPDLQQTFDRVFSGVPTFRSGTGACAQPACTASVHQRHVSQEMLQRKASDDSPQTGSRERQPQAFGLERGARHRQDQSSGSNGSINFMYTMRNLSQSLVVNKELCGVLQPRPGEASARGSGPQLAHRRHLTWHARPATAASSTVGNDSGSTQQSRSGRSSAEIEAMARGAAHEWRSRRPGNGFGTADAARPQRRVLHRSGTRVGSSSRQILHGQRAERAAEAARDPAWCVLVGRHHAACLSLHVL